MRYILSLIVFALLTTVSFSQTILFLDNDYYTYVPLNVGATASTDQIIFSGAATKTRSNQTDGSSRAFQRWMRWWIDSTDVVTNGTFDSNVNGWDKYAGANYIPQTNAFYDSLYRIATYEDLTGVLRIVGKPTTNLIVHNQAMILGVDTTEYNQLGGNIKIRFQATLIVDSLKTGYGIGIYICGRTTFSIVTLPALTDIYISTGRYEIDTTFLLPSYHNNYPSKYLSIRETLFGSGDGASRTRLYLDNVSLIPVADSVSGYTKLLSTVAEDVPYYYSQSGQYRTRTDTVWAAAEVDTVISWINGVNFQVVTGLGNSILTEWQDQSYSEVGYEVSYKLTSEPTTWTVFDTSAVNVQYMEITDLAVGDYNVRIRTIGDYINSDYSSTWNVSISCELPDTITVLSAVGSPTNITLTWTDVTSDSVYIYKGITTAPTTFLIAVNDGVETYEDTDVVQGTIYFYRLRAYENVCEELGAYSATIFDTCNIIDEDAPSAPTNVAALNIRTITPPPPPDTIPALTAFTPVTGAALSSYHQGYSVATLFDSCTVYAAGDSFKVGVLSSYDVTQQWVYNTDSIYVPIVASSSYSTAVTSTITAGGTQRTYSVTTLASPIDTIPTFPVFTNITNAALNSYHTSAGVTLTSFDSCQYYAAGDSFRVNGGALRTAPITVYNNDVIYHTLIASSSYLTAVTSTGTAGGVQRTYSVTTSADPASYSVWYVSNTTHGNGSADSWANADVIGYGVPGAFSWAQVGAGDTVYIDGGTDSLTYYYLYINTLIYDGDPVVITAGKDAGHNGEVWFIGEKYSGGYDVGSIQLGGGAYATRGENIKFVNLNLLGKGYHGNIFLTAYCKDITIEDCHIYADTGFVGYFMNAPNAENFTIRNNHFETYEAVATDLTTWADGMYISAGNGGHIIDGNTIIQRGGQIAAHKDCLQIGYLEGSEGNAVNKPKITISNNFFYCDVPVTGMNCAIYGWSSSYLSWNIYNNVVHWAGPGARLLSIGRDMYVDSSTVDYRASVRMFNNTMYVNNPNVSTALAFLGQTDNGIGRGWFVDTLIMKNNLIRTPEVDYMYVLGHAAADYNAMYKDLSNNYYYEESSGGYHILGDTYYTLPQWQALGYDTNSVYTPIAFVDVDGQNITDYVTTTGRDLGIDLSAEFPFLATDILGNPRTGSWDVGAIEYQGGGMLDIQWKRIEPFLRNNETDFWRGQK